MEKRISMLIVGGGTAGWMAANLLAHRLRDSNVDITVVESDAIATVGVGEGSTPYLKNFFRTLDIPESEWMPACQATYKCGIRFPNWCKTPGFESYFHPFFSPLDREVGAEFFQLADRCRMGEPASALPDHFFHAPYLADAAMSPIPQRPLPFELDYAYHFDAGLLGTFLKKKAITRGVQHRIETVSDVVVEGGEIKCLNTESRCQLIADFYIDCTGFRSQLLSALPGYCFRDYSPTLFNNAAVTLQQPRDYAKPLVSATESAALTNGWMWRIPLQQRTGFGYVYSADFISEDEAERELRAVTGASSEQECRHLKMRIGRVEEHWSGNCLGIGLSQGFIEPLEATALMLVQFTLECFIGKFVPACSSGAQAVELQEGFNKRINRMFDGVLEYVAGHYVLNSRTDSEYWRAAREDAVRPAFLAELLSRWDSRGDFSEFLAAHGEGQIYSRASWYCLLAGMGRFPCHELPIPQVTRELIQDVSTFCRGNIGRFRPHEEQLARFPG
ncbi:tryptophan halogenase family protein [Microbulbifer aggregans]|uniref:tryptophan halogenase family protein n=1 Tax=Microbulbifer aggregans TaxID=1769779 RepID=UPI001CFEE488|nr:tryptophan halogenase family protein [Microbulbifer aggregans]